MEVETVKVYLQSFVRWESEAGRFRREFESYDEGRIFYENLIALGSGLKLRWAKLYRLDMRPGDLFVSLYDYKVERSCVGYLPDKTQC